MILPLASVRAPARCPAASSLEMVQGWRRDINQIQARLIQVQDEIDLFIYGNGAVDVYHLEEASNKLEPVLEALRKEAHRIEDGE